MRSRLLWFLLMVLLLAAFLWETVHVGEVPRRPDTWGVLPREYGLLTVSLLVTGGMVLVVVLFGLDFDPPRHTVGDLDRLLVRKQGLPLVPRSSRKGKPAVEPRRSPTGQPVGTEVSPNILPVDDLGRLLWLKRKRAPASRTVAEN